MKVTRSWLNEFIAIQGVNNALLAEKLTRAGLEVDSVQPVATAFTGVVTAIVLAVAPHPQADRLQCCQVQDGEATYQVVCGAKNVRVGMKVALAKVGACLPGLTIAASELRGEASEGMLCSLKDLGLAEVSEGLIELPIESRLGADVFSLLGLEDQVFDIDLTPNRGDCFSVLGIARELSFLLDFPLINTKKMDLSVTLSAEQAVNLIAKPLCPRYLGRVVHIDQVSQSPFWLTECLRRVGLRAVNVVVDVLNYVMWALGQPLHAFDLDKIEGGLSVRKARPGETLISLDEVCLHLSDDDLIIADTQGPLALAGVMGGFPSRVTNTTTRIFIESAYFDYAAIARSSQRHHLQTDAAQRFARGVDFNLPELALNRAIALLQMLVATKVGPLVRVDEAHYLPARHPILFSPQQLHDISGVNLSVEAIERHLNALGMEVAHLNDGLQVTPPSYRFDVSIAEDLVEEVLRLEGYDTLPTQSLTVTTTAPSTTFDLYPLKALFAARDYHEVVTYSFISEKQNRLLTNADFPLVLLNPLSQEMAVMRGSLWPSLLATAQYNLKRQQSRVRLFEMGHVYYRDHEHLLEKNVVAGLILGDVASESWQEARREVDFFDIKGDLEAVLSIAHISGVSFEAGEHQALQPGQTAVLTYQQQVVGYVGLLHPRLKQALGLKQAVYLFELALSVFSPPAPVNYRAISKFPAVRRDFALIVDEKISSQALVDCVMAHAGNVLLDTIVFDVYTGKNLGDSLKSVAIGLILQDSSRTLVEEDVARVTARVVAALEDAFAAKLRDG